MKKLLALDFGSKRIGVAITNEGGDFALPHSIVQNSPTALQEIVDICEKNGINKIIMGESKDFSGQDNPIMKEVGKFAHDLRNKGIYVDLHPEFLTSAQAERLQGKNDMLDASAAAIILQSFLDLQKNLKDQ